MSGLSGAGALLSLLAALMLLPAQVAAKGGVDDVPGSRVELPPAVTRLAGTLQPQGSGDMTWFGLKIYDASLWAASHPTQGVLEIPFALAIRYQRQIPASRLVDTSIDEIARLGFGDERQREQWRELLARALPSVAPGETLVGLHLPGRGASFWHDGRPTAEITDQQLARAFFAIWLDERTRKPGLRSRLLGNAQR